jgi:hypothetical protein
MADVGDLEEALRTRCLEIVDRAGQATMEATRDACPIGNSGVLRDSHEIDPPADNGDTISSDLHVDAPHAEFVAGGTRPHLIVPHRPPAALHFEVDGNEVFATVVHHPGTQPNTDWWSEEALASRWSDALDAETS